MQYIFFGAGKNSSRYVRILQELTGGDHLQCFVDNHHTGAVICGKPVIDFSELKKVHKKYIILLTVSKPRFVAEIASQLQSAGIPFELFDNRFCLRLLKEKIAQNSEYYQQYKKEIDYMLQAGQVEMIPYPCRKKYLNQAVEVQYVSESDLYCYHLSNDKKLFFPRTPDRTPDENVKQIQSTIRNLLTEQDISSPHRYFTPRHRVNDGDVFVDIGAAEAMTSLEVVDKASKVYVFEGEERWKAALQATFASYDDKVVIVDKFVSDHDDEQNVKMDTFFKDIEGNMFIKVDIEGSERSFLRGAEKTLQRKGTKISLCVYHYPQDAEEFMPLFQNWGYRCELSPGWLFVWGDFAHGVMYGQLATSTAKRRSIS